MAETFTPYERIMVSLAAIAAAREIYQTKLDTAYMVKTITEADYTELGKEITDVIKTRLDQIDLRGAQDVVCFLYEDFAKSLLKEVQAFAPANR